MAVKRKRLTNAEKKMNASVKAELRAKGIIPPVKPKLNRKKFSTETLQEYRDSLNTFGDITYLYEAIAWMSPSSAPKIKEEITLEQIGVMKLLKIALAIKNYNKKSKEAGQTTYKPYDLYTEVVKPILEL